eukprot:CAMPEP_0203864912 /NCGR_PEP_ID=MMETSP0359-20131031/15045_1 /ASSEMBLY_ACC=CAM_ASM_000338 /TAXON_ID=268821 /ORGANISM="Scrippsiella Hangoei, Strain SHTV-5" /LENGTH=44 /DNA_ID= /DNA_START= /DNA_END= /DNA_ORIENTATION=
MPLKIPHGIHPKPETVKAAVARARLMNCELYIREVGGPHVAPLK